MSTRLLGVGTAESQPLLFIEPNVLQAPIAIDAVLVQHDTLHVRMPACSGPVVKDHGSDHLFGELTLRLPHDTLALFEIEFLGLPKNEAVDIGIAVLGVIAFRVAGVILDQVDVGIVDGNPVRLRPTE